MKRVASHGQESERIEHEPANINRLDLIVQGRGQVLGRLLKIQPLSCLADWAHARLLFVVVIATTSVGSAVAKAPTPPPARDVSRTSPYGCRRLRSRSGSCAQEFHRLFLVLGRGHCGGTGTVGPGGGNPPQVTADQMYAQVVN